MLRLHHYKKHKEVTELDVTTFLNLMVVLIPFLLLTAVFSRITIMELNVPTSASAPVDNKRLVIIEVIVRKNTLQIADGSHVVAAIPKQGDKYDLPKLSKYLQELKSRYAAKEDATVLFEPEIPYEDMAHVMDAVRVAEIREPDQEEVQKIALFPAISVGDAP